VTLVTVHREETIRMVGWIHQQADQY
jgi:hypothetical protein